MKTIKRMNAAGLSNKGLFFTSSIKVYCLKVPASWSYETQLLTHLFSEGLSCMPRATGRKATSTHSLTRWWLTNQQYQNKPKGRVRTCDL